MISQQAQRLAHRRREEGDIAANPSAAIFRTLNLVVRTSEPAKTREFRIGGLDPVVELEAWLVLPLTAARPQPEQESIDIAMLDGEVRAFKLVSVTPLRGLGCFKIGLRSTRKTVTTAPVLRTE